ncbi:hypothetical protein GCM10028864_20240 [Microlunatus parietis]
MKGEWRGAQLAVAQRVVAQNCTLLRLEGREIGDPVQRSAEPCHSPARWMASTPQPDPLWISAATDRLKLTPVVCIE